LKKKKLLIKENEAGDLKKGGGINLEPLAVKKVAVC